MTKSKTKTRKPRQPRPIPAMLEGAFSTRLENIIAEMNNTLARENRLTNDPAFVMLVTVRKELVKEGIATFERSSGVEAAPAPKPKSRKGKGNKTTTTPPPAADTPAVREIEESELEALAVDGTVSDEAPYGRDSKGVALAPYGVKLNGAPKKRRGRPVEAPETTEDTPEAEASGTEDTEEDTEDDTEETEETDEEDLDEDELDDLLADL